MLGMWFLTDNEGRKVLCPTDEILLKTLKENLMFTRTVEFIKLVPPEKDPNDSPTVTIDMSKENVSGGRPKFVPLVPLNRSGDVE